MARKNAAQKAAALAAQASTSQDPANDSDAEPAAKKSKKQQYRKDKPWDTDDIDHWAIQPFEQELNEQGKNKFQPFLEESSFATLFPKYREVYLREIWGHVETALGKYVSPPCSAC